MPKITFIEPDGKEYVVDAPVGMTVMEAAKTNGVPGIDADCGGSCSCATCRVYVDPDWMATVGKPGELESDMLDFEEESRDDVRLSCQIPVTAELDGLVVRVPPTQG